MVCLAEKIHGGTCRRGRGGARRRGSAARRQGKTANAPFALHGNPHNQNKKCFACSRGGVGRVNAERGAAINGRCYVHAGQWANAAAAAAALCDTYINGTIQPDARIYTQFDANYNVTALIGYNASTNTWGVVQRYVYTPYGVATVLDANWNATTDQFNWQYMHQGGRQDPVTGLYDFRNRDYSPTLGNWIEQDPLGYVNGGNAYSALMGDPAAGVDPLGQCALCDALRQSYLSQLEGVLLSFYPWGVFSRPSEAKLLLLQNLYAFARREINACRDRLDPSVVREAAVRAIWTLGITSLPFRDLPQLENRDFAYVPKCGYRYLVKHSRIPFSASTTFHASGSAAAKLPKNGYELKVYFHRSHDDIAVVHSRWTPEHFLDAVGFYSGLWLPGAMTNSDIAEAYLNHVITTAEYLRRLGLMSPRIYRHFVAAHPNGAY